MRKEYFGASRPASTLIEISQFVRPELLIEVEAVAVLPDRSAAKSGRRKPVRRPAPRKGRRR